MFNLFNHSKNTKRGFTLLLAALVSAIVLSLGSAIFTIARKQVTLSSLGRDSQFAFYSADTVSECALYWDVRFSAFATSSVSPTMGAISCDGQTVTPTLQSATANSAQSTFQVTLFTKDEAGAAQNGNCAQVTVYKNPTAPFTIIHADGYNTPCNLIQATSRTLQRTIEIQY